MHNLLDISINSATAQALAVRSPQEHALRTDRRIHITSEVSPWAHRGAYWQSSVCILGCTLTRPALIKPSRHLEPFAPFRDREKPCYGPIWRFGGASLFVSTGFLHCLAMGWSSEPIRSNPFDDSKRKPFTFPMVGFSPVGQFQIRCKSDFILAGIGRKRRMLEKPRPPSQVCACIASLVCISVSFFWLGRCAEKIAIQFIYRI